ncbi:5-methylcytosine restriction system specificity protein McrC [Sinorhizobium meliloti]|uniref:5-methylcytosine restriction system specificity protein McrC n=1 Tax=Rhizobium meliloti TaxID=382 RepID=UPI000FDC18D2|nr:hypothetical protein [Sinorhizobium meliloti]RVH25068.1 hypothetical protein CN211_30525 [Sinorhizobium meliloti]
MIPIRNIYYLLLYAWGQFKSGGINEVGADQSPDVPNLLAKVLNEGTHRLLRRGLDRGYIAVTEETRSPRGRLRLDVMMKQQTLLRGTAVCDVDDLTPDILHNQILKTTLVGLANCSDVEAKLRHELQLSVQRMPGVSPLRLSAALVHRVQLSRNTSQYSFLMRVCELVYHALLPDEQGIGTKFNNILEDETRMEALFEEFLRNFYRSELPGYSVKAEIMPWLAAPLNEADLSFLPIMKTDVTLRSADRALVADAKYYKEVLAGGRFDPKLRSAHLYQLSTYLTHVRVREPRRRVSGLLIYPAASHSLRLSYRLIDTPVTVATVNLAAEWPQIHAELIELIRYQETLA